MGFAPCWPWKLTCRSKCSVFSVPFSVRGRKDELAYQSFEDLEVWKRSCKLAVEIYASLQACRDFALRDQMQKSAVSVASNIAEGSERGGKDFIRFLKIAQGSAAELRTQCYIAARVGVISHKDQTRFVSELKTISRMLTSLAQSLTENRTLKTEN